MSYRVITDDNRIWSSREIQILCNKVKNVVPSRSLVFCLCQNSIGSLIGYISFLQNGVVPIMLDATKNLDAINTLSEIYRPNYIWAPFNKNVSNESPLLCIEDYCLYPFSSSNIRMDDRLALLLTTSGSTGSPKMVRLTIDNLRSNAESIAEYLNINSEERPITTLPMYYSYGLSVLNSHLIKGATILLTDKSVLQKEFWLFAKTHQATSISGVPYTYEMLRRLRFFNMDLPSLMTLTQAGGKLNAEIAKYFIENSIATGRRFFVMYGQTEATARMSYLPIEKSLEKYSSIGIPIPGGKLSIIDESGNKITSPEVDGELVYDGPNVSMGYAECIADLAKADDNGGRLHTGDIAHMDADGYFYITGRLKRFVKVWGNRCNLDAIEQLVKTITTNCACVGIDDRITVFVEERELNLSIVKLLAEKTGFNQRAFCVKYIESIPKSTSGKIQYSELQKLI